MDEIFSHILLEAKMQHLDSNPMMKSLLREFQGVPDQLEPMLDAILATPKIAEYWEEDGAEENYDTFTVEFDMYPQVKGIDKNFLGPESYLRIVVEDAYLAAFKGKRPGIKGGYVGEIPVLDREAGLLKYACIEIKAIVDKSEGLEKVLGAIRPTLAHELLHVYEDFNRRITDRDSLLVALSKHNYNRQRSYEDRKFSYLCNYFLDPAEQRAFITGFCADIQATLSDAAKAGKLRNARDIESFLALSRYWKRYDELKSYIYNKRFYGITDPKVQKEYVDAWNRMVSTGEGTSRPAKSYKDFLNKFFLRWEKFDDTLKRRVSQVVSRNLANFSVVR